MCGIIGFLGKADAIDSVLDGLTKLEYRGYDSAGIAYLQDNKTQVVKSVGHVDSLIDKTKDLNPPQSAKIAIGHTRWSTHGEPTELNAHPHLSNNGEIAVVHNGIIENYLEIIELLKSHGIEMRSQTDTEVIPNLIQIYFDGDLKKATGKAIKHLKGSYAIVALAAKDPTTLICAKHGMPLCIGAGKDFSCITSDIPTALSKTQDIYVLDNGDMAVINPGKIEFFNKGKKIEKQLIKPPQSRELITKGPFSTFMEKEINDIPEVFQRVITHYRNNPIAPELLDLIRKASTIHICACGSAYHAGLVIGALIEKHCRIRVSTHIASEFRHSDPLIHPTDVGIVISQSGETADTMAAMNLLRENRIPTIAICNINNSALAREADYCLPMLAGFEIAVASTKAYCSQVLLGAILVDAISDKPVFQRREFSFLPMHARSIISKSNDIQKLAEKYVGLSRMFFLGKGLDAYAALESALKVKQLTYIQCEGYHAGELKHGPLSLVNNETLTGIIQSDTDEITNSKIANATAEVKARGSKIWKIETPHSPLAFCFAVIPAQLFALHLSKLKGINPDKPRHLAKAVTVG
jgi:glucosamine--fructose-6-phosphate aminotransferase (isomerizing)